MRISTTLLQKTTAWWVESQYCWVWQTLCDSSSIWSIMRLALFSMDCSYESSIVLKMHFPLFWYLHFEKKIQQLLIFASWWNVVLTIVLNIAGPPQNYSALRPVHCHRMRTLLHLRRSLRLLRLQMLQGHHVPLWLHIWLHCCLPHLCRGGGLARLGYKSTKSDFEQKNSTEWSNALIAMSAGLLFGLITMLVQYVGLFMLGFHTGHPHLGNAMVLLQWFSFFMCP